MKTAKTFEDLIVWQKAHAFVLCVYKLTAVFPKEELYGLSSQFRRAAVSIAANIAEGFRKRGDADKVRFLNISQGSLEECRYYLRLTTDLNYRDVTESRGMLEETSKLLNTCRKAILNPVS
jgi:four helix bundle protein